MASDSAKPRFVLVGNGKARTRSRHQLGTRSRAVMSKSPLGTRSREVPPFEETSALLAPAVELPVLPIRGWICPVLYGSSRIAFAYIQYGKRKFRKPENRRELQLITV